MDDSELRKYRLNSTEEPTDEQLEALMEKVAEAARESTRRYQAEMDRRMRQLHETIRGDRTAREKTQHEGHEQQ